MSAQPLSVPAGRTERIRLLLQGTFLPAFRVETIVTAVVWKLDASLSFFVPLNFVVHYTKRWVPLIRLLLSTQTKL
ncbi:hypothetical protein BDR04DRAFT_66360 [Suillus decipiens]|nr:hypothetical protein BDR04DRAFT_66360 [Suillus decipiens]